jgi:Tfp pilus assembly protein PilN
LIRCAVLLLLAAPAFYLAELLTDKALLSSVERGRKAIAPLSSRLESLQSEVARLKGFASKQGSQLVGEDACFALFSAIDKARPQGLLLTSISGSPWGEITASGKAASYSSLLSFVERLGNDSSASSVELSSASLSNDGSISFHLTAKCVFAKEFRPAKPQEDAQ